MKRIALALAAIGVSLFAQRWLSVGHRGDAIILFVVACILYIVAVPRATESLHIGLAPLLRSRNVAMVASALAVVAALLVAFALPHFTLDKPTPWGWTLHLASLGAAVAAALFFDFAWRPPPDDSPRVPLWTWVALALMVAVAAALRLTRLDSLPFGVWYDEAENALAAIDILRNPTYRPFYLGSTFHTAHFNYIEAFLFSWLGEGISTARLVSVLMGIAMVPAGWLVGYEFFYTAGAEGPGDPAGLYGDAGRGQGLIAPVSGLLLAAILTFSAWSLNFSRIAVNYIATPLCILLATGFLLRGLRTQRLWAYGASGLALAVGLYFYSSFRLFAPVLPIFVLAVLIARRDGWKASWRGLLVMSFVALITAAPLMTFALTNRDDFLSRSRNTYILKDAPPEQTAEILLRNTTRHLTMFNNVGDPNGRHNLPGRSMLDPLLAALFVIGLGASIWRWRHPLHLLLILWLGFTLLGGILTLDFESPQSLRANGAFPAAYLLALVPVVDLLRAWARSPAGRYYPRVAMAAAGVALAVVAAWNVRDYFVDQQHDFASWNAFSTPETLAARTIAGLDPERDDAWVISYYFGHPTLHYLAPEWRERYRILQGTDTVPLPFPVGKDIWLFMDVDSRALYEKLKATYPNATFEEVRPPFSDTVSMRRVHLTPADVESVQGLLVVYDDSESFETPLAASERVLTLDADWATQPPLALPFSAEWRGVLRVDEYAPHGLLLEAPGQAELYLNETVVLSGSAPLSATLALPVGNLALRVRATGGEGPVRLSWQPPNRPLSVIPSDHLYHEPVTTNGLLGRYFANGEWQPPEQYASVDPQINIIFHTLPLNRPFTVEWTGKIAIPLEGRYLFAMDAIDAVTLLIDEQEILSASKPGSTVEGEANLSAGLHDIRIRYAATGQHNRVNLYWVPPNGERMPVPSMVLFPPQGNYDAVEVPSLALLAPIPAANAAPAFPPTLAEARPAIYFTAKSGLSRPAGIATGPDGRIYVADTAGRRLLILSATGALLREIVDARVPFVQPFDVATSADGLVYLLDSEAAALHVFDADGEFLRTLPVDPAVVGRARGIHVDRAGDIWVANTALQRIYLLSPEGEVRQDFAVWPNAEAQVTDVVTTPDGSVYATVLGVNKLVRMDPTGRRLGVWDLPAANTLDGPHLAVDAGGAVYLTQPEESRILKLNPADGSMDYWQLPRAPDLVKPVGIAIDASGALWFTDVEGGRVLRIDAAMQDAAG